MKKVILILLAAVAFSCGDGRDRSSESGSEIETEDNYSDDALESDTTEMEIDTTATQDMDREGELETDDNNP